MGIREHCTGTARPAERLVRETVTGSGEARDMAGDQRTVPVTRVAQVD